MPTLIIGLGNLGGEYVRTRHNVGWMCLDRLEEKGHFHHARREGSAHVRIGQIAGYDIVTARPTTYMNLSGKAAKHLSQTFGVHPPDVIVIHDDMDIPFGRLKIKRGGHSAGQKGVESLINAWGTADFIRVRIGIGRPPDGIDPVEYVLSPFTLGEKQTIQAILDRASDAAVALVKEGVEATMTAYNGSVNE